MKPFTFNLGFVCLAVISTVARSQWPVLDYAGNDVKVGAPYDLWGVGLNRGPIAKGSFVGLSKLYNFVINKPNLYPSLLPDPILLFPSIPLDNVVLVNRDYNIIFDGTDEEQNYGVWRINDIKGSEDRNYITTGGRKRRPSCTNTDSWFQFVLTNDTEHLYKMVYKPQVCFSTRYSIDVTSQWNNQENRLYVNVDNTDRAKLVHFRFAPHQPTIRQVVDRVKW